MNDHQQPIIFSVRTGIDTDTHVPFLQIVIEEKGFSMQVSPGEAIGIAYNLIAAAEAATTDATLVGFMLNHVGANEEEAITLLGEFRQWRNGQGQSDIDDAA